MSLNGGFASLKPMEPLVNHVYSAVCRPGLALPGHRRVEPAHGVLVLRPEVALAAQPGGQARGRVLVDEPLDVVGVGQPRHVVVGVAGEDDLDVRLPAIEHPGPGADHRLDLLEVAELLHALLGDDPGRRRGEQVDEPGVRLLERELDRVLVDRLDLVDVLEHRLVGVAGDGEEPLVGVLDVVGRQLAAVDRRLVVPAHALLQLEDVGRVVRLGPRLGEVGLDRVRHRLDRRAGLHLHETAVARTTAGTSSRTRSSGADRSGAGRPGRSGGAFRPASASAPGPVSPAARRRRPTPRRRRRS